MLASVLGTAHWGLFVPENLDERLALADEIIALSHQLGDRSMLLEGHWSKLGDLVELGDTPGTERSLEECDHLAEEIRQPYHRWTAASSRVALAHMQGRMAEVEQLAQRALQVGQEANVPNAAIVFGIQITGLFRDQGRQAELEPLFSGLAELPVVRLNVLCGQAALYMDQGRRLRLSR